MQSQISHLKRLAHSVTIRSWGDEIYVTESESVDTYIEMGESNSDEELIVEVCNETSRATPFSTNVTRSVITSAGETPRGSYPCEDLLR